MFFRIKENMGNEFDDKRRKLISRMGNYTGNAKVLRKFEKDLDELIKIAKEEKNN